MTSVFPSPWKESEIVPILKDGGDPEVANGNRPVSLLPALSKTGEQVALNINQWHMCALIYITEVFTHGY